MKSKNGKEVRMTEFDESGEGYNLKEVHIKRKPANVVGTLIELNKDGRDEIKGMAFSLDDFRAEKLSVASPGDIDLPNLEPGKDGPMGVFKGFKEQSRVGILGKLGLGQVTESRFGVTLSNATFDPKNLNNPNNTAILVNGHSVDNRGVDLQDGDRLDFIGYGRVQFRYELNQ